MSLKRAPTSELNHDNWNDDNPEDHEDMGTFTIASKDVIEKRVMRTAKRRSLLPSGEAKKNVFSGFGGFNKTQPASFDFLAKLTNGSNDNSTTVSNANSPATSSLFSSKPLSTSTGGLFGTSSPSKSPFGSPSTQAKTESLFGGASNTTFGQFAASSTNSKESDSPFKVQSVTSSPENKVEATKLSVEPANPTKFDIPSTTTANLAKSLFSNTSNSTPFKIQTNATTMPTTFNMAPKSESNENAPTKKPEESKNEKRMQYYSKLRGLNESVSDWIKKHVEQTPLCILSPIFKDYEAYLKDIQEEYESVGKKEESKPTNDNKVLSEVKQDTVVDTTPVPSSTINSTSFIAPPTSKSLFAPQASAAAKPQTPANFSFGIGSSTSTSSTMSTSSPGFSFGTNVSSVTSTSSLFSLATTTSTTTTNGGAAPFSFGISQPFSFSSNVKQSTQTTEEANDEEDTPPKVEYTPLAEDNSVYDKKCKIFVKKDGNFVDKGVGTLYIKKIEESDKHQLLVRANNSLGTILINLILASAIPTQRTGKNNVMMVCIPTPDAKPPPTPVLVRVKTSGEADELLETLNKYKT